MRQKWISQENRAQKKSHWIKQMHTKWKISLHFVLSGSPHTHWLLVWKKGGFNSKSYVCIPWHERAKLVFRGMPLRGKRVESVCIEFSLLSQRHSNAVSPEIGPMQCAEGSELQKLPLPVFARALFQWRAGKHLSEFPLDVKNKPGISSA